MKKLLLKCGARMSHFFCIHCKPSSMSVSLIKIEYFPREGPVISVTSELYYSGFK